MNNTTTIDAPATQQPSAALKMLQPFIGNWHVEGQNFESAPHAPNAPVSGREMYEWLPGNFYMIGRWDHLFDGNGHKGIAILGCDTNNDQLFTRNFDNLGYERKYELTLNSNTWTYNGAAERATREFSEDEKSFTERWEILNDGQWEALCELKGVKIEQPVIL